MLIKGIIAGEKQDIIDNFLDFIDCIKKADPLKTMKTVDFVGMCSSITVFAHSDEEMVEENLLPTTEGHKKVFLKSLEELRKSYARMVQASFDANYIEPIFDHASETIEFCLDMMETVVENILPPQIEMNDN